MGSPRHGYRRWLAASCLFLGALLSAATFTGLAIAQKPIPDATRVQPIEIRARTIESFDKTNPAARRFGRLSWRGGLVLTSPAASFGGWSGLVVDSSGRRLLAVSDAGTWLTAEIVYDGDRLAGVNQARLGPLLGLDGKPLTRGRDRDAEAITLADGDLDNGTVLIAFEGNHRIGRFRIGPRGISPPIGYLPIPPEAHRMKTNVGFESVAVLKGGPFKGSIVAIAERLTDARGHHTGWIWVKSEPKAFHLTDRDGFDITDAAALPDGGLIVLERRFRWTEGVRMRLRLIAPHMLTPGAVIEGETLIEANMSQEIDNMEGVAVHRGTRGETVITLISDDNFNHFLQRTLLLQFALDGPEPSSTVAKPKPR